MSVYFQPMPKRFIVWSTNNNKFITVPYDKSRIVFTLEDVAELLSEPEDDDFIICQSTNLFDKNGKEIFEGGIIDYDGNMSILGVVVNEDGEWCLKDKDGNRMFLKGAPHQILVGHILSNPELLEGK